MTDCAGCTIVDPPETRHDCETCLICQPTREEPPTMRHLIATTSTRLTAAGQAIEIDIRSNTAETHTLVLSIGAADALAEALTRESAASANMVARVAWDAYQAGYEGGIYDLGDLEIDTRDGETVTLSRPEWGMSGAHTRAAEAQRILEAAGYTVTMWVHGQDRALGYRPVTLKVTR